MVSADERMPVRGKGRGKAEPSGKKPEKRARKSRQKADQPLVEAQEQTDAPVASVESSPAETAVIDLAPVAAAESSPAETAVIDVAPVAAAESSPAETVVIDVAPVAAAESSPAETVVIDVAPVAAAESSPAETVVIDVAPIAPAESRPVETAAVDAAPVAPAATVPVDPVVPTQPAPAPDPVSYQAITNAYGDFTRKSIEQTSSFFEQLAGARSFNRAFQLQTEYAQKAYETFVAESEKIRELHCELNRQRLQRFESLVTGTKATRSS
jgi:hypothetical protein